MTTPAEVLTPVLATLDANHRAIADTVRATLATRPTGTMRQWMERHHGGKLTTIQVDTTTGAVWAPTGRTVDASRATSVSLDKSYRDYAGMRVHHVTPLTLVVADDWHTIVYILEGN